MQLLPEIVHTAVSFDGVARVAHQLQVADGVHTAPGAGRDVVNGQHVQRKFVLTADALAVLARVQQFLVRLRVCWAQEREVVALGRFI